MANPRRRRRGLLLVAVVLVLALGGWWINRQLEPSRLTATVLRKAGAALQLQLKFSGQPEYAFKPEPRLLLPNFSASGADGKIFLSARRAQISLPWSTITGGEAVITRIQLEQPVLNLPGLRRWMATLPKKPFELPTLSKGIEVIDGAVLDESFSVRGLALELPHLKTGDPAAVTAKGQLALSSGTTAFELHAQASTAGLDSNLTLNITAKLPTVAPPVGAASAAIPDRNLKLELIAHYNYLQPNFSLAASSLSLQADDPLPSFTGSAKLNLASQLSLQFDGALTRWPGTWPALPPNVAKAGEKLPVHIDYRGKRDFSDPLSLVMAREPTVFQATVRIPELRQWLAAEDASLIPPLNGKLRTPKLAFDGVELQGVEIELSDGPTSGANSP